MLWFANRQALIESPVDDVWALVGNPKRYDEWWPRVVRVDAEDVAPGCEFRQVVKGPLGRKDEHTVAIEELEDCHVVQVRCVEPGVVLRWELTQAGEGTFVDARFGVEIENLGSRVMATLGGKRFLRRWAEESLEALREAAARP